MKIKFLMIVSAVMFALASCSHAPQERSSAPRAMVVDVRTQQEWDAGHLDGAVLIPYDKIDQGIVAVAPDKKSRIYLYCRTGRRTGLAYDTLKKAGYEDLINLSTLENASKVLNLPIVK